MCPSGLRSTLGKRVCGQPYRRFESSRFRQVMGEWQKRVAFLKTAEIENTELALLFLISKVFIETKSLPLDPNPEALSTEDIAIILSPPRLPNML